jgi:hypothetical protein
MTSLYVLTGDYLALANKLSDSDMDDQTIRDTLEGASGELEEKATNVACFIRNLESQAEAIKSAEKQMAERRKAIEKKAEHLSAYLKESMVRCGKAKIDSPYFCISIKKNPPSVVIDDAGQIPTEFYVYPDAPPPHPDKTAIDAALKSGKEINGAHLVQAERLEIK